MSGRLIDFLKRKVVLIVAVFLAVMTSFVYKTDWHCIDVDILLMLYSLMLVVSLFKSILFLDWFALELLRHCQTFRGITFVLVGVTFFASMVVTNDVALLTFVPLALILGKDIHQDMVRPVIFMTLAANLGSMLTPLGNPQNLFLFNYFHYQAFDFLKIMIIPVLFSAFYITILMWRLPNTETVFCVEESFCPNKKLIITAFLLLMLNIAAVLHYVEKLPVMILTLLVVVAINWRLLLQVDYSLLFTFIGFFIFIGNIQHINLIYYLKNSLLRTELGTYLMAILSSQIISNVPSAMLLAGLTNQADALLTGVNVGGLGTLIASMASVISYQLFVGEYPCKALKYLQSFTLYNFSGLFFIGILTYFIQ